MIESRPNRLELNVVNDENASMNSYLSNSQNDPKQKKSKRNKGGQSPDVEMSRKIKADKRIDCKGVKIIKGGKKHQIAFKNNMVQVHIVDNWKQYNVFEEEEEEEISSWTACKRKCSII